MLQPFQMYAPQTASYELQHPSGVLCRSTNHSNRMHAARSTCRCRYGAHRSSSWVQPYPQPRRLLTTLCVIQYHVGARQLYLSSRGIVLGKAHCWNDDGGGKATGMANGVSTILYVAWNSCERHSEINGQPISSAPVDNYRCLDVDS